MFILDRTNGKPVFGVEERPVPKGDVPGEWYSPTQPFPLKPPPLARIEFKPEDMVTAEDTTPEHAKACQEVWEKNGGSSTTPVRSRVGVFTRTARRPRAPFSFPAEPAVSNWGGTAADPKTGYVFFQHARWRLDRLARKEKAGCELRPRHTEGSNQPYDRGSVDGPGPYHGFSATVKDADGKTIGNWPCQKPPWARLIAVNANTGDIAWQTPLGSGGGTAGRQAEHRIQRQRRAARYRRRPGVYRRD